MSRDQGNEFRQVVLIALVAIIGLGLTLSATREAVKHAEKEALSRFEAAAELYVERVNNSINQSFVAAQDLHAYYRLVGRLSLTQFEDMVEAYSLLSTHRSLVVVAYPVDRGKTDEFVDFVKGQEPTSDLASLFTPFNPEGTKPDEDGLARSFFISSAWGPDQEKAKSWIGLNIGAWPEINAFLEQVLKTGMPSAIPMPSVAGVLADGPGLALVVNPLVSLEGQSAVMIQLLDLKEVAHTATSSPRLRNLNLQVESSWANGAYSSSFSLNYGGRAVDASGLHANSAVWANLTTLDFGGQQWHVMPWAQRPAFKVDYGSAVITASVCILLTGLIIFIVWSQSQRARRVVEMVNRRTRALKEAHEELEEHYNLQRDLNKDVEEARKAAETANLAKSEFLATMSHELRTPLNAILGFSQLLREQALGPIGDSRYVDYAQDINTSGSHLLSLINDILDLAKLEAGKISIEHKVVDVRDLVDRVFGLIAQQVHTKPLELREEFSDDMPTKIWGDELRLRQILINLISNAVKFTHQGSVTVRLFPENFAAGQPGWVIEVEDTGIGIPEEKLETLFDRFTQVDTTLSRRHGGAGLGLAICRELSARMNGSISVKSTVGKGTTFRVHLPLDEVSLSDADDGEMI